MFGNIPVLRRHGSTEGGHVARRLPERGMFDLFEEFFNDTWPTASGGLTPWNMARGLSLDMVDKGDEYEVRAELPGVDPKETEITVERGVLTIRGERKDERKDEHEDKKENYLHRERVFGSFSRSIRLPGEIDEDKIKARFDKGVLRIHLPKSESRKPKRIAIN